MANLNLELFETLRAIQPNKLPCEQERDEEGFKNWNYLTSLAGKRKPVNIQSPMAWQRDDGRFPTAVFFHSNPYKTDRKIKPWADVLLPDEGFVYYNGDN